MGAGRTTVITFCHAWTEFNRLRRRVVRNGEGRMDAPPMPAHAKWRVSASRSVPITTEREIPQARNDRPGRGSGGSRQSSRLRRVKAVSMPERPQLGFIAQIRSPGRSWVSLGTSATRAAAARQAAQAYAAAPNGGPSGPVQVRVVRAGAGDLEGPRP